MINWILIVSVTAGAMLGNELARRRAVARGVFFSFQPVTHQRILALFGCFAAALCVETGRIAIVEPNGEHVWYLIAAVVVAFVLLMIQTGRELKFACREVARLKGLR